MISYDTEQITQLKQQVEKLKKALVYADDITETVREPFVVLDADLRVITANLAFYQTFHIAQQATEGELIYALGNNQWNISKLRHLLETILPKHTYCNDFEVDHAFPTIGHKTMFLNARRIYKKQLILLAIEDITERKRLIERKERDDKHFRALIEKRKDDYIRIASHELKTPLTSIKAFTQILKQKMMQADNRANLAILERMDNQVNRFSLLIKDLLDASRIQTGNLTLNQEYFDMTTLAREVIADIWQATKQHKIVVKSNGNCIIFADKDRIGQVLTNLIENAIKYSPKSNKVAVSITSKKKACTVCVKDYGIGVPRDDQRKIFERFYRAIPDNGTFQGQGLGLFIASEIMERHQGKMWVESSKGKGSTFYFSIPIIKKKTKQHVN